MVEEKKKSMSELETLRRKRHETTPEQRRRQRARCRAGSNGICYQDPCNNLEQKNWRFLMMNEPGRIVKLSFRPHMDQWNESGRKCRTTRLEKKAEPEDVFFRRGICYQITWVLPMTLVQAVCGEWSKEGYSSRPEFVAELMDIYPELTCDNAVGRIVWVYHYHKWGHIGADRRKL